MPIELTREFEIGKPVFNGQGILTFESFRDLTERMSAGSLFGELGIPDRKTFHGDRQAYYDRYACVNAERVAVKGKSMEVVSRDDRTYFRIVMIPFGPLAGAVAPEYKLQLRGGILSDDTLRIVTFDVVPELSPGIIYGKNTNGPIYRNNGS